MWSIISQIFPYAMAFTAPLLITSLGGLFSEKSGVVNIGLEGLMVMGSFASALVISILQPIFPEGAIWLGLAASMIAGILFSLLHAFASINLNANQVISGTAINMIAGALTVFIARNITGSGNIHIISGLTRFNVPLLSKIPVIGKLFFTQTYLSTWLILLILLISWFVIYKTAFGLRLRACGDHPHAGISCSCISYIRSVETYRDPRSNFLFRLCNNCSKCFTGCSRPCGNPSDNSESFSLCCYSDGINSFFKIIPGAKSGRAAV
jgi:simple sugar transport system permease protein